MQFYAPLADRQTLNFILEFCSRELQRYGILEIYLIGSRASGVPRPTSDHDVVVILSDAAPEGISLGGPLHMQTFLTLDKQRRIENLGAIDLITVQETRYHNSKHEPDSFAYATLHGGIRLL